MDQEKQGEKNQQRQSDGNIGQGINAINNLVGRGIKNPFGKIIKPGTMATRGFSIFLASHPWVWAVLGTIIIVVVFTFVIVGFGGAPVSETNDQTALPTLTPTPPAAP